MGQIGFVNICHEDYKNESLDRLEQQALQTMKQAGISVSLPAHPACNFRNAQEAGIALASRNLDGIVLFLGSWLECPVAMDIIREVEHLPLCLWGFPMFEENGRMESTGSYVSFAMFKGSLKRAGYHFSEILALPDSSEAEEGLRTFAAAAHAKTKLRRARVGLVGYTSMGIYTGTFDHLFMRTKIGPEIVQSDSYSLICRAERQDAVALLSGEQRFQELGVFERGLSRESIQKSAGLYSALKGHCAEAELDAINVKCQYEFSKEYGAVPCVALSALADDGVVAGCEGDILCTVSQLILHLLTGQPAAYGDTINHSGNVIKFSSCGMLPFSMGEGERLIRSFMPHPAFTGLQVSYVMRPERVTFLRLVEDVGSYHFIYGTGQGQKTQLRQGYMPALDVNLDGDINRMIALFSGQHFALCYGDRTKEVEALATMLGIGLERV